MPIKDNDLDAHLASLHDATLVKISFDWDAADATILVKTMRGSTELRVSAVVALNCEHHIPWGKSVSINSAIVKNVDGLSHIELEMQSGDKILVLGKSATVLTEK